MRITHPNHIDSLLSKTSNITERKRPDLGKEIMATGTGIEIRTKSTPDSVIKQNRPDDPFVSKKVLDSLSLGLIDFSQAERDTLAKIMMKKAAEIKE